MKVNITTGVNPNANDRMLGRAYSPPKPIQNERNYGGLDIFIAGQMKYNPIARAVTEAQYRSDFRPEDHRRPMSEYNPYDEPDELAGYPMEMFIDSRSPEETAWLKNKHDRARYVDDILAESGAAGIVSSIGGGMLNPAYLVPLLGWSGRAMTAGQRMMMASSVGAGTEAVTELAFHGIDATRTMDESAFNIAAGAIFSGVLGSAMRGGNLEQELIEETLKLQDDIQKHIAAIDEFIGPPIPNNLKALSREADVDQIKGPVKRLLAKLTPIRILASDNPVARKMGALLGEQTVIDTSKEAIETAIKKSDGMLVDAMSASGKMFKDMTKAGVKMSRREFDEQVAYALRNGDEHANPYIQAAAREYRSRVLNPLTKQAQKAGLLPEELVTRFARSYFPRMYNFPKIKQHSHQFVKDMKRWFMQETPELTEEQAEEIVMELFQDLTNQIVGEAVHKGFRPKSLGPLKGRTVYIPDNVLEPYLLNEVDNTLRHWTHTMSAQIELNNRFGSLDLKSQLDEVDAWWAKAIADEESPIKSARMQRQRKDDLTVLEALRDRLLNRYKMPENPDSGWVRAGRAARNLNVLRHLGGMAVSSIPDMARPLYQHGLHRYAKAMTALATSPQLRKIAVPDLRRMGVALDMTLNQRLRSIAEQDFMPFSHTRFEAGLERMVAGHAHGGLDFGKMTGMTQWNTTLKTLTGLMSQDGLLARIQQPVKNARMLKRAGIDENMARRILEQYRKHGRKEGGLRIGMSDDWDDFAAARAFESSIVREVDATIVTPGAMDKPLWMSAEIGKVIGQIKSFAFASTNKQMLAGMNHFDVMIMQGVLASVALGALTYNTKKMMAGKEPVEEWTGSDGLLVKGMEYSGTIGFVSELLDMGRNIAAATGIYEGDLSSRWATQGLIGTALGPTFGLAEETLGAANLAFRDQPRKTDIEAARSLIPYNNHVILRRIFDRAESAVQAHYGTRGSSPPASLTAPLTPGMPTAPAQQGAPQQPPTGQVNVVDPAPTPAPEPVPAPTQEQTVSEEIDEMQGPDEAPARTMVDEPNPPERAMEHLRMREGVRHEVYLDSEKKPTAGVGHLMTPDELQRWPVGARVSVEQVNAWLEEDRAEAWLAARQQGKASTPELVEALFHVNFQLGKHWRQKMPKTWKLIEEGKYGEAAIEVQLNSAGDGPSKWKQQTPVRVDDFVNALERLEENG